LAKPSTKVYWTKKSKSGRFLIRGCIGQSRVTLIVRNG
jgi:hypothetical protein